MKGNSYASVSGSVFGIIAVLQAMRAVLHVPVQLGNQAIPLWVSWVAALIAGSLCVWAFRAERQVRG